MLNLRSIVLKNFLSVGAVSQSITFEKSNITLVLGENVDLGGDGNRNGVGKSALLQAVSYALYGEGINSIRKDNLINRTNGKGMVVTIDFDANGKRYRITRGRKPNILKFYIDEKEVEEDATQGENKDTQVEIERVLCMSHEMFKQIVCLNTYSTPFLGMKVSDQRLIIEQLLGITILSEKAENLKLQIKNTKDQMQAEEFMIKGLQTANQKINEQIVSLERRSKLWEDEHEREVNRLVKEFTTLDSVDIHQELENHRLVKEFITQQQINNLYESLTNREQSFLDTDAKNKAKLQIELDSLETLNLPEELASHEHNARMLAFTQENSQNLRLRDQLTSERTSTESRVRAVQRDIKMLEEHKCHACGQDVHDETHEQNLKKKQEELASLNERIKTIETKISEIKLHEISPIRPTKFATVAELTEIEKRIEILKFTINHTTTSPFKNQIEELEPQVKCLGVMPKTFYETEQEAVKHEGKIATLEQQILVESSKVNPYDEQIVDMKENAIQVISFTKMNELNRLLDHQKFVLELLTNKDSFVRKRIIDQNLAHLNARLSFYLDKIGLPHQVVFMNDLSVEITELGRELDFYNLSRGEMTRLILALSFAFRDVWESLYHPMSMLFCDELLDNGLDTAGLENSLSLLKDMCRNRGKSVFLISHRDELVGRVENILRVYKEGGFTSFEFDSK